MLGRNSEVYKRWKKEWEKYKTVPFNIEVANLGSSGDANNFDYKLWRQQGFNFASAPQDMYYDNQVLEQYAEHLKEGAVVIICLSEFALIVDRYDDDSRSYKYYGYLEPNRIVNYSKGKHFILKIAPGLLNADFIKQEMKEFIKKLLRWDKRKDDSKELQLSIRSRKAMKNWMHEFGWDREKILTPSQHEAIERSWLILERDIELCHNKGFVPMILIPPFNHNLKELMPTDILDDCLWKFISMIKERGIEVLDFWNDEELQRDEYYETSICLNEVGRKKFNKKVEKLVYKRICT